MIKPREQFLIWATGPIQGPFTEIENPGELIRSFFLNELLVFSITAEDIPAVGKKCTPLEDLYLTTSDLSTLLNLYKSCVGM